MIISNYKVPICSLVSVYIFIFPKGTQCSTAETGTNFQAKAVGLTLALEVFSAAILTCCINLQCNALNLS